MGRDSNQWLLLPESPWGKGTFIPFSQGKPRVSTMGLLHSLLAIFQVGRGAVPCQASQTKAVASTAGPIPHFGWLSPAQSHLPHALSMPWKAVPPPGGSAYHSMAMGLPPSDPGPSTDWHWPRAGRRAFRGGANLLCDNWRWHWGIVNGTGLAWTPKQLGPHLPLTLLEGKQY